jgi:hypothetical protein
VQAMVLQARVLDWPEPGLLTFFLTVLCVGKAQELCYMDLNSGCPQRGGHLSTGSGNKVLAGM